MPPVDPLQTFLDSTQLTNNQKADVWDNYHAVRNPQEFQKRFDSLSIPTDVKAHLWDMRFPAPPKPAPAGNPLPEPSLAAKVGSYLPDSHWTTDTLQALKQNFVDPFEAMAKWGAEKGSAVAERAMIGQINPGMSTEQFEKNMPNLAGAVRGVGNVAGGAAADPRNWPFAAGGLTRPLLNRLINSGFALQMGKGTYDAANHLIQNWDKMTPMERSEMATQGGLSAILTAMTAHGAMHSEAGHAETRKPNPTEQVSQSERPAANPITPPDRQPGGTEYERLKARLAQLEQSKKGSQANGKVQPTEAPATAKAQESTPSPVSTEARGEPVPTAAKSEVAPPTLQEVAQDWRQTAQAGPSAERKILADMTLNPAEDIGGKVRQQMPPMPRGERRAVPRTPEEEQTQTLFAQARKELGEDATSDQVMARVDELKKKPDVRDLYAGTGVKEAERTPEQIKADREAFLGMTKKYSGENALGPREDRGLGPSGIFKGPLQGREAEAGTFSLRSTETPEYRDAKLSAESAKEQIQDEMNRIFEKDPKDTPEALNQILQFRRFLKDFEPKVAGTSRLAPHEANAVKLRIQELVRQHTVDIPEDAVRQFGDKMPLDFIQRYIKQIKGAVDTYEAKTRFIVKPSEGERGSFSLRPRRQPPGVRPSVLDRLRTAVADKLTASKDAQDTMNIIRERGAEYAQNVEQMIALFEDHVKSHDNDGDLELRQFMDAGEGKPGAQFANSTDQQVADVLKDEFQKRWQKLSKLPGREDQGKGIENYLKHLFVGPSGQNIAERIMYGKRPLKGAATFEKHRFYQYLSDGMDMGLVPVTYNPVRMQLLGLFEIDRYLMAHDMKNDMKASGLVKFYKLGQQKPDGWQRINDQIFQPRVRTKGGIIEYGNYYAPKDAARVFNNYLSPGLRGNLAYDIVRNYGNLLNQVQLGFSAYHAVFSALNSGVNDMALGMQKALGGKVGSGTMNMIRGALVPWSAVSNYRLGKAIEGEYRLPGSNPGFARMAQALKEGGGRIGMDPMYENRAVEAFKRQLKSSPISLKTPVYGVEALAEKVSAPIMKYLVPRLKIGAFANLAEFKLDELVKNGASHNEVVTELGKIWDSIDNRLGQLTYDNLFWKKTYKDLGMVGVRSLGWNLGSLREGAGALKDTALQAAGKQKLQLTPRQAYVIALPMLVGAYGTLLGYLTGHPPHSTEDRFFPQTGGVDDNGKPERLSLPSYMRDVYAFSTDTRKNAIPWRTFANKAHPLIQQTAELLQNRDFYNTEIRDTSAPLYQQAGEIAKYLGKSSLPFGISASMQRHKSGESWPSSLGGIVGLTPAPKYIGQSRAEEIAYDLAKRHMEAGPFPAGTQEQRQFQYQVRNQFHAGKLTTADLLGMVKSGKLSPEAAGNMASEKGQPPLVRHFNTQGMSWDERLKIWDAATPEEKAELKPYLLQHVGSLSNLLPDQRQAVTKRLREIFVKKT